MCFARFYFNLDCFGDKSPRKDGKGAGGGGLLCFTRKDDSSDSALDSIESAESPCDSPPFAFEKILVSAVEAFASFENFGREARLDSSERSKFSKGRNVSPKDEFTSLQAEFTLWICLKDAFYLSAPHKKNTSPTPKAR